MWGYKITIRKRDIENNTTIFINNNSGCALIKDEIIKIIEIFLNPENVITIEWVNENESKNG